MVDILTLILIPFSVNKIYQKKAISIFFGHKLHVIDLSPIFESSNNRQAEKFFPSLAYFSLKVHRAQLQQFLTTAELPVVCCELSIVD